QAGRISPQTALKSGAGRPTCHKIQGCDRHHPVRPPASGQNRHSSRCPNKLISVLMDRVFEALASTPRRKILAYLAEVDLTSGEIAARFQMSKPAISKHLQILENAGLVTSEKRGQYVHYSIVGEHLANTLNGFVQHLCPVSTPLRRESAEIRETRSKKQKE
ncbi:MAG: metalloregulator ArsR/SmtB family transcription factor, partial [Novosphingobium sp.]|nr:metalloregulator ArsR/SmtB family transcription factor [Novosphingobium sp.]